MEKPEISFKLELLGNLILQLKYWTTEFEDGEIELVEEEFDRTLEAVREMREVLLEELDGYFEHCKVNNEPVYLPYWTVRRELRETTFQEPR
jgi:hypothetical protein